MTVVLPTTFLLDSDGKAVWGYVKVYVEGNSVLHVDLALASEPHREPTWSPFATLTIVEGRVAYLIHGNGEVLDTETGDINDSTGRRVGSLYAVKGGRKVDAPGSAQDERDAESEGDHPAVLDGAVGEDAQPAAASRRVDPDPRD